MKALRLTLIPLLLVLMAGCSTLGITPAQSFPDKLAYAYGNTAALRNAATNALSAGTIGSEDATYVLGITDQSRGFIDAARMASESGDASTAEGRLNLALTILQQLETYLNRKLVKP